MSGFLSRLLYRAGIANILIAIIVRNTLMRPRRSDIHPDRILPEAFPNAPTTSVIVERAAAAMPTLLANGTNWLITINPAEHPSAYPSHIR